MRRLIGLIAVAGLLVAGSVGPADAGKRRPKRIERVVEHTYQFGSPGAPGVAGACLHGTVEGSGCFTFPTSSTEAFVTLEVDDASGTTPSGILGQDTDPNTPGFDIFHTFCGGFEEPVAIPQPGMELRISVYALPAPGCAGAGTTGSFKATLSNMP